MNTDDAEIIHYYRLASIAAVTTCADIYPTSSAIRQAAAECAYIEANHALPTWSRFVEAFEYFPETDNFVFVHADPAIQH